MAKTLRWMAPKPARYGGFKGALISLFFFFLTDLKLLLFFLKLGLGHFGGDQTRHKPRP